MRIIRDIVIDGKELKALFDTGSANTYILEKFISLTEVKPLKHPFHVGLGGDRKDINRICVFEGEIEGLGFSSEAYIIDALGTIDGVELDAIIGARTMEGWEIKLDPKTGDLDLTGLRRREFTEY